MSPDNPAVPDDLRNLQYSATMEATIKPRPIHVPPIELGSIDLPPPLPLRKSSDKRIRAPFLASNTPTLPSPKRGCLNQKVVPTPGCGRGRRTSLFKTQQNNGGTAVGLGQDPPPPVPGQHNDPEANSPSDPDKIITPAPVLAISDPKEKPVKRISPSSAPPLRTSSLASRQATSSTSRSQDHSEASAPEVIDDDVVYIGDKVSREVEDVSLPDGSQGTTQAVPFPTPPPVGEGWTAPTSPKSGYPVPAARGSLAPYSPTDVPFFNPTSTLPVSP